MSLLYIKNLTAGYEKKEVLHDISLEIGPSKIMTLIGSNGAGKSTLLKAVYGLQGVWKEGEVVFDGDDISHAKPETLLQKCMVYIGQKSNTFDSFSVDENLKTAGYLYDNFTLDKKLEKLYTFLPKLKVLSNKKVNSLSGGQKQLVALGMGILHEPKLILFDEPSAGLDVKSMKEIFNIITDMRDATGISFVIVEHRVKEIASITDIWVGLKLGEKIRDHFTLSEYDLKEIFL